MPSRPTTARAWHNALVLVCCAAFAIGLIARAIGWDRPLWVDETFTGAIAAAPTPAAFIEYCLHELSGPFYYGLCWVWAHLFGYSNVSLRLPSLLSSLAAPLLLLSRGHPVARVRLVWAAMAATLYIVIVNTTDARAYCFLFLMGAVQLILFRAMATRPTIGNAAAWALASITLLLTHYYALPLIGLQGIAYLWLARERALRTWPAALLFAPAFAWMAVHIPVVTDYAQHYVWQPVLTVGDLRNVAYGFVGALWRPLGVVIVVTLIAGIALRGRNGVIARRDPIDAAIVATSLLTIGLLITTGFFRPSFQARYLMPALPGALLALALAAERWAPRWPAVPVLLVTLFAGGAVANAVKQVRQPENSIRASFSWQAASAAFEQAGVRHVAYYWADPQNLVTGPRLLGQVGGFFFHRDGAAIRTDPIFLVGLPGNHDPNRDLPAILDRTRRGSERDAFLWIYVPDAQGLPVVGPRPDLAALAPHFACRNYAGGPMTVVLGCIRRPASFGKQQQ